jgi:hypothetical protein
LRLISRRIGTIIISDRAFSVLIETARAIFTLRIVVNNSLGSISGTLANSWEDSVIVNSNILLNLGVAELGYDKFIVRAPKNNASKNQELMKCPES